MEEKKDVECEVSIAPLGIILCEIWKLQTMLTINLIFNFILIVTISIVMLLTL